MTDEAATGIDQTAASTAHTDQSATTETTTIDAASQESAPVIPDLASGIVDYLHSQLLEGQEFAGQYFQLYFSQNRDGLFRATIQPTGRAGDIAEFTVTKA